MTDEVRGRPERAGRVPSRTEERVARAIAFGFLPGGLVFGALVLPTVAQQWSACPPAWTIAALSVVLLPPLAIGVLAFGAPLTAIRAVAFVGFAGALVATASLPLVVRPGGDLTPWTRDIAPIGVILGVLAATPTVVLAAAVLEAVLIGVDRAAASSVGVFVPAVQDTLYALLFETVFVALGVAVLTAGRAADEAETQAQDAAVAAAADAARERERARVNALVHDRVLATLLSAAHRTPGTDRIVRADAARALRDLRGLLVAEGAREPVDPETLIWTLQAVTTDLAPDAVFGYELHPDAPPVPPEVVDTLAAATEEALRNSLRHAAAPNHTVHVEAGASLLRVEVLDDGVGFDPGHVPPTRLGIAESILGRMRALPDGEAFVVSTPGVGTRVQLRVGAAAPVQGVRS